MAYKDDLRLAFSGKEIALERIALIESTVFENETAEQFSRKRREKYQKLLEQSDMRISEIKSRIAEDISAKRFQLEDFQNERTQVTTRYQLREISHEEHEKIEAGIRKKFDKVRAEADALQQLCEASTSSEIGGRIPIDIEKDVDDYGNIIRKSGIQMPNVPTNFRVPSDISDSVSDIISKVKRPDNISIQGLDLSRNNLIALAGAIGVLLIIVAVLSGGSTAPTGSTAKVTLIMPGCGSNECGGYEWSRSGNLGYVVITAPGAYAFAKNADFPDGVVVSVKSAGVTLDGKGITLLRIDGRTDLDLKNIHIESSGDNAISECRNIKDSSIVIRARGSSLGIGNFASGIYNLYGNIDDTTSITVINPNPYHSEAAWKIGAVDAFAVSNVYGTISGGTFITEGWVAAGVGVNHGTISGGKFTITGEDAAFAVYENRGKVSGGTFTMNGYRAYRVYEGAGGTISGGRFNGV